MAKTFRIIHVDQDSIISDEPLGSKKKFWFLHQGQRWLFKEARANTGEDWAEKIAAELAHLLKINAAKVELAECKGCHGSASKSFVHRQDEYLAHGNEILAGYIAGYDRTKRLRQCDHTFENIAQAVRRMIGAESISEDLLKILAGYLLLDALICNTDRHHENWGFLIRSEPSGPQGWMISLEVAPSFDHASSLGRELRDDRRARFLADGNIANYARKGRGGIYLRPEDKKGANPLHLAEFAARKFPAHFHPTLARLRKQSLTNLLAVVDQVPGERMSPQARLFVKSLLEHTHRTISELTA